MNEKKIRLAHGGGGALGNELIEQMFLPILGNPLLNELGDQAVFDISNTRFAFTTDSYVIKPYFFPGGDIGELSVYGTVNDLSMGGARPLYLSLAMIIEEGFPMKDLQDILESIKKAADSVGVLIATGDTKVVDRGSADGIFINTAGVGVIEGDVSLTPKNIEVGDRIIVSGTIGDHGMAILAVREGLIFDNPIQSDTAPLNGLVARVLESGAEVHAMRDPTRGGVASTLNEFAGITGLGFQLEEKALPVRPEVMEACEILGFDPLQVANEGKLIAVVDRDSADSALQIMRNEPLGGNADIIGEVTDEYKGKVVMKTVTGTNRVIDMVSGEQLPRIC